MEDGFSLAPEQQMGVVPDRFPAKATRTKALLKVAVRVAASGLLVGALWAWIAPSIHAVVAISRKGERVHDYLGSESQNFFVAPFMLLGLLGVVAVVAAVAAWQWREHRGPEMVGALAVGLIGAASVAAGVGALLVRLRYGALDFNTVALSSGDHSLTYVQEAPPVFFGHSPLQIAATLLVPTGIGSLIYALIASGAVRDDLGADSAINWQSPTAVPPAPLS